MTFKSQQLSGHVSLGNLTHVSTSVSSSVQLIVLIVSTSRGAFIRTSREYVEASGILLGIFLCMGCQSLSSFSSGPLATIPGTFGRPDQAGRCQTEPQTCVGRVWLGNGLV